MSGCIDIDNHECKQTINMGNIECTAIGNYEGNPACDQIDDMSLISVSGVCSKERLDNLLLDGNQRWAQLFIPEILCVPRKKPVIEQVVSVAACTEVLSQKVIDTPIGSGGNEEGTFLTGRKLVIEGLLREKVVYVAGLPQQSVHSVHFDIPFSAFIVLAADDLLTTTFKIDICIEDIYITKVTDRRMFKNVTVFLKATPLVCA